MNLSSGAGIDEWVRWLAVYLQLGVESIYLQQFGPGFSLHRVQLFSKLLSICLLLLHSLLQGRQTVPCKSKLGLISQKNRKITKTGTCERS